MAAKHVDHGAPTSAMVFFAGFGLVLLLVRAAYRCVNQDESTPSTQVVRRAPIMSARPKALLEPVTPSQLENGSANRDPAEIHMPKEYAMFTPQVSGNDVTEALEPPTEQETSQVRRSASTASMA